MSPSTTIAEALREAVDRLGVSSSPRLDAELLLAESLDIPRARLYTHSDRALDAAACDKFRALVGERGRGKPVPYLTGRTEFFSLDLAINEAVLVPRPETELLVELALEACLPEQALHVADLGTGSGAIAAALALARPASFVTATDRFLPALELARLNLVRLGVRNARVVAGDWLRPFAAGAFDMILANPPYVADAERIELEATLGFEPDDALYAGADGLSALVAIIEDAPRCLTARGRLALEHGDRQGRRVRELLRARGFSSVSTRRDLAGRERVSSGVWP
jgi:release factor glutamine methyltransferase